MSDDGEGPRKEAARMTVLSRRAVVSYPVSAEGPLKRRLLRDGLRDVACELYEAGEPVEEIVRELEQVANDLEAGELI